jgi:hypothetical protein
MSMIGAEQRRTAVIGAEPRRAGRRSQSLAQLERDAALERVSRTRRWMILAAGALSAAFAALVSAIAPGHSLSGRAQAQTLSAGRVGAAARTSGRASSTRMPPLASPADLGLQGPSQNPQAPSDPSQAAAQSAPSSSGASVQNPAAVAPAPTPAPVVSGGS